MGIGESSESQAEVGSYGEQLLHLTVELKRNWGGMEVNPDLVSDIGGEPSKVESDFSSIYDLLWNCSWCEEFNDWTPQKILSYFLDCIDGHRAGGEEERFLFASQLIYPYITQNSQAVETPRSLILLYHCLNDDFKIYFNSGEWQKNERPSFRDFVHGRLAGKIKMKR